MSKQKFTVVSFLLVASMLFLAPVAKPQESEIEKIIREVSVDTQKGAISNYTYLLKVSYDRHRLAGRKFTRLYEAILPSRIAPHRIYQHQILLIQDSERLISELEIIEARKEMAKALQKAENEADAPQKTAAPTSEDGGYWSTAFSTDGKRVKVDILKLLQISNLSNLERRKVEGRDIVTIDFLPKPESANLEKPLSYLSKIEGRIVIDEADKRIVRIEGFAPGEFSKQKDKPDNERQKEVIFLFSQTKVAEGFWFPQTIWLNFEKHPEIFETIEIQYNFSNYKRANVDVKDTIETPKEQTDTTRTKEKQN
jgi:hypothetical protein